MLLDRLHSQPSNRPSSHSMWRQRLIKSSTEASEGASSDAHSVRPTEIPTRGKFPSPPSAGGATATKLVDDRAREESGKTRLLSDLGEESASVLPKVRVEGALGPAPVTLTITGHSKRGAITPDDGALDASSKARALSSSASLIASLPAPSLAKFVTPTAKQPISVPQSHRHAVGGRNRSWITRRPQQHQQQKTHQKQCQEGTGASSSFRDRSWDKSPRERQRGDTTTRSTWEHPTLPSPGATSTTTSSFSSSSSSPKPVAPLAQMGSRRHTPLEADGSTTASNVVAAWRTRRKSQSPAATDQGAALGKEEARTKGSDAGGGDSISYQGLGRGKSDKSISRDPPISHGLRNVVAVTDPSASSVIAARRNLNRGVDADYEARESLQLHIKRGPIQDSIKGEGKGEMGDSVIERKWSGQIDSEKYCGLPLQASPHTPNGEFLGEDLPEVTQEDDGKEATRQQSGPSSYRIKPDVGMARRNRRSRRRPGTEKEFLEVASSLLRLPRLNGTWSGHEISSEELRNGGEQPMKDVADKSDKALPQNTLNSLNRKIATRDAFEENPKEVRRGLVKGIEQIAQIVYNADDFPFASHNPEKYGHNIPEMEAQMEKSSYISISPTCDSLSLLGAPKKEWHAADRKSTGRFTPTRQKIFIDSSFSSDSSLSGEKNMGPTPLREEAHMIESFLNFGGKLISPVVLNEKSSVSSASEPLDDRRASPVTHEVSSNSGDSPPSVKRSDNSWIVRSQDNAGCPKKWPDDIDITDNTDLSSGIFDNLEELNSSTDSGSSEDEGPSSSSYSMENMGEYVSLEGSKEYASIALRDRSAIATPERRSFDSSIKEDTLKDRGGITCGVVSQQGDKISEQPIIGEGGSQEKTGSSPFLANKIEMTQTATWGIRGACHRPSVGSACIPSRKNGEEKHRIVPKLQATAKKTFHLEQTTEDFDKEWPAELPSITSRSGSNQEAIKVADINGGDIELGKGCGLKGNGMTSAIGVESELAGQSNEMFTRKSLRNQPHSEARRMVLRQMLRQGTFSSRRQPSKEGDPPAKMKGKIQVSKTSLSARVLDRQEKRQEPTSLFLSPEPLPESPPPIKRSLMRRNFPVFPGPPPEIMHASKQYSSETENILKSKILEKRNVADPQTSIPATDDSSTGYFSFDQSKADKESSNEPVQQVVRGEQACRSLLDHDEDNRRSISRDDLKALKRRGAEVSRHDVIKEKASSLQSTIFSSKTEQHSEKVVGQSLLNCSVEISPIGKMDASIDSMSSDLVSPASEQVNGRSQQRRTTPKTKNWQILKNKQDTRQNLNSEMQQKPSKINIDDRSQISNVVSPNRLLLSSTAIKGTKERRKKMKKAYISGEIQHHANLTTETVEKNRGFSSTPKETLVKTTAMSDKQAYNRNDTKKGCMTDMKPDFYEREKETTCIPAVDGKVAPLDIRGSVRDQPYMLKESGLAGKPRNDIELMREDKYNFLDTSDSQKCQDNNGRGTNLRDMFSDAYRRLYLGQVVEDLRESVADSMGAMSVMKNLGSSHINNATVEDYGVVMGCAVDCDEHHKTTVPRNKTILVPSEDVAIEVEYLEDS